MGGEYIEVSWLLVSQEFDLILFHRGNVGWIGSCLCQLSLFIFLLMNKTKIIYPSSLEGMCVCACYLGNLMNLVILKVFSNLVHSMILCQVLVLSLIPT